MRRLALLLALIAIALLAWLALQNGDHDAPSSPSHSFDSDHAAQPVSDAPSDAPAAEKTPRVRAHATVATPDERPAEPEETRSYTVRVVDHRDAPVPGVSISLGTNLGNDPPAKRTRSDGSASWDVATRAREIKIKSPLFDPVVLQERETIVRLDDLLPLEIQFIDQESRRPVGVWIQGSPLESDDVLSNQQVTSYEPRAAPVRAGRRADLKLWFDAPDGYVVVKRPGYSVPRSGFVSRYATAVRTTVPVARELRLRVRALRHDGSPAENATASISVTGDDLMSTTVTVGSSGESLVAGLPFVRGEHVIVRADDAEGRRSPTEEALLVDSDRELTMTVRLPKEPPNSAIGIGGGIGSAFSDRSARRRQPEGTGRLIVTVSRRNGLAAGGALVMLHGPVKHSDRADDAGRVEFDRLPAGKYRVHLREPGLVYATGDVELTDGESRTIALREPPGRAATVRVLDADGLPLPNVRVHVQLPWRSRHVQVNDGLQELDHWTDLSGRVRFTDLPKGKHVVVAEFGSRRAEAPLVGDTVDITIPNR